MNNNENRCPNCGAAVTTEICEYCHAKTGLDTNKADMEYPVIECKEVNLGAPGFIIALIMFLSFGFFGFLMPIIFVAGNMDEFPIFLLFFIPFALVSLIFLVIVLIPVIRYIKVKTRGKNIDATVYGYMLDEHSVSGGQDQVVKLKVETNDGPKFILYQLGHSQKLYKVNSIIKLKVYKDIFMIVKEKKYYFE